MAERPQAQIVIFDSTAPVGQGDAVDLSAAARAVGDDELERARGEAFHTTAGARPFAPEQLREPAPLRLHVATETSCQGMDEAPIAGPTYGERRFGPRWSHLAARWEQAVPHDVDHRQLVLPDGCADVVVLDSTALLVGPTARRDLVDIPGGTRIQGLRLRPGAAGAVLRVPAAELRDRVLALDDVVGRTVAGDLVGAARGDLGAAWRLEERGRPRIREALALLADGNGVGRTARSVGLSERQLRREVLEHAGLGPKTMQRVLRLQRLLRLADRGGRADGLARLAADAGYADQAHLAREVRRLCGLTPLALLAHRATGDPAVVRTARDGRNVQALA